MNQNVRPEQVQGIIDQHIAPLTRFDMALTQAEIHRFCRFDFKLFTNAIQGTSRWLKKKNAFIPPHTPSKGGILKSVYESCVYNQNKQAGTLPTPTPTPSPAPVVTEENRADKVRGLFQSLLTSGEWTITEAEAEGLLKEYSMKALKNIFNNLGRTYAEDEAQQAFDSISWAAATQLVGQ